MAGALVVLLLACHVVLQQPVAQGIGFALQRGAVGRCGHLADGLVNGLRCVAPDLHMALLVLRERSADPEVAESVERRIRHDFDESSGREAALARLAMAAHRPAAQMLDVAGAGVAVFATALALASGQSRDRTVLSFTARQQARLALALRAAGLDRGQVDTQLLVIHPDVSPPGEVAAMPADRAAAVLATAATAEEATNG